MTVFTNLSCAALLHPSSFQVALTRRSFPSLQKARARDTTTVLSFTVFRDDFAVLPNLDRCAMHTGGLARDLGGTPQRAADCVGKFFAGL